MKRALGLVVAMALLVACERPGAEPERCAQCEMDVTKAPRWNAGLTTRDGAELRFDSPNCMIRYYRTKAEGARDLWVQDFQTRQRIPADRAFFVSLSDVLGPMGHDLVSFATRQAAQRFLEEHHGREIVRLAEVGVPELNLLKKGGMKAAPHGRDGGTGPHG